VTIEGIDLEMQTVNLTHSMDGPSLVTRHPCVP